MARVRKITTMAELQAALQAAFNAINRDFYNSELEKVIITTKEGRKKNAYGWIEVNKNWQQNGTARHEINISVDFLGERTVIETITTLMHEMAHLYNIQHEIKDTTRSGLYHNKEFKKTAEAHGLMVSRMEKTGWSYTRPKESTILWIEKNITIKSFGIFKRTAEDKGNRKTTAKQSYKKYICPACGLIVRATKECNIACMDCDEPMYNNEY